MLYKLLHLARDAHLQERADDFDVRPAGAGVLRRSGLLALDIQKRVTEVAGDHLRGLYALEQAWWSALGRVDIGRRDIVDARGDELNKTVHKLRGHLRSLR